MAKQRRNKGLHWLVRLFTLAVLVCAGVLGWQYLRPMMMAETIPLYAAYTVETGPIATDKSFSAQLSVLNSETHQNTTGAETIKEVYVKTGQTVKKGDKLMLLDDGTLLEAGLDGVVNEMRFGKGDWLWHNVQLIQICDLENLKVTLSVDEYDVENVSPGQMCTVHIIPLGEDFETKIKHVNRVSSSSGQVAYYTATAELSMPERVMPGMSVSVTIPAEEKDNALYLDMAALAFDDEGKPYVLRKASEGYVQVPVETGLSNGTQVEILSGLQAGEEVWAVAGEETVSAPFSLVDLYKQLAGETVIINDMTGGNRRNGGFPGRTTEGMTLPDGMTPPEGFALPDGMTSPEGFTMPEGMTPPVGMPRPGNEGGNRQ